MQDGVLTLADLKEFKQSLIQHNIKPMGNVVYACIHPLELYWFWGRGMRRKILKTWYEMRPWLFPFWTDDLEAQERSLRYWWECRPWRKGVV